VAYSIAAADLPVIDLMIIKPFSYFDEPKDRNPAYNSLVTKTGIQCVHLKHIDGIVVLALVLDTDEITNIAQRQRAGL